MSDLLLELVRRYSPSREEAAAVAYLVEWMAAHGLAARRDEVGNAVGVRGADDAARTLLLLGHIDTFPGNLPVDLRDGAVYGRGSVDAKGSLCAFAEAAAHAAIPDGWRVMVVGAVEEEAATSKGARHIRATCAPDLCIIGEPSGADRVTLGYKGRLVLDFTLTQPVVHTARPEPSVGALGAAFWTRITAWAEAQNAGVERYFDQIMPDLRAINTETDHLADTLRMTVAFRLPPRVSPDAAAEAVAALAPAGGQLSASGAEHAYLGDKNNALVRALLAAIRAGGGQPGFVVKTGTSDMNVVGATWRCPIVAYGPGDSSLDHTPGEHLPLDEYGRAVAVLRHVIEHLPAG